MVFIIVFTASFVIIQCTLGISRYLFSRNWNRKKKSLHSSTVRSRYVVFFGATSLIRAAVFTLWNKCFVYLLYDVCSPFTHWNIHMCMAMGTAGWCNDKTPVSLVVAALVLWQLWVFSGRVPVNVRIYVSLRYLLSKELAREGKVRNVFWGFIIWSELWLSSVCVLFDIMSCSTAI